MRPDHAAFLSEVFERVLEEQAFVFGDHTDAAAAPPEVARPLSAAIRFRGEMEGRIHLLADAAAARRLAASMLGVEPDEVASEAAGVDALGEIINVTCGQLLTTVAGEDTVFELEPPVVGEVSPEVWAAARRSELAACFFVEDDAVLLVLEPSDLDGVDTLVA